MTAPILIFGWGNPSRGDDALGPRFIDELSALGLPDVECLSDYQLQIEHALDLAGRQRVLFVDASITATVPYAVRGPISASAAAPGFTHALDPHGLLRIYENFYDAPPPPCFLLEIRGESFILGAPCSEAAQRHLAAALDWARKWLE
ncbi:hydrogenase maturation protease [Sulfuricystis multivorans]|uniref:hydrogenase maturation protease n=1 Tax=Sulfuricystis multivorans TaxID=2211108 RepID=UPI000F81635E|nr:hydrogenase maturation protease [Sulfuricystis multivorans]